MRQSLLAVGNRKNKDGERKTAAAKKAKNASVIKVASGRKEKTAAVKLVGVTGLKDTISSYKNTFFID